MLSITVLGSGSSGNCAVVRTERSCLLVDAGLSARRIVQRLADVGIGMDSLDGILLTHEHGDHTQGLEVLCRKHAVPLYATPLTQEVLQSGFAKAKPTWKLMQTGQAFDFQDLRIECFPVPHDAVDPVGFVIQDEESRLGVLSDVGFVTNLIRDRLRGSDSLFIEANYDGPLLEADTKRPWSTKQRISGRHGHLSNEQAAELILSVGHSELQHIVLGHLSEDCNDPDVAHQKIYRALQAAGAHGAQVHCAKRHEPLPWLEVARRKPAVESTSVTIPVMVEISYQSTAETITEAASEPEAPAPVSAAPKPQPPAPAPMVRIETYVEQTFLLFDSELSR